ncbi:MAG: cupin domain-containing protein [Planctomycetota bacterium]
MPRASYLDVELAGRPRAQALARCARQVAVWKLTMPLVRPLVLDFALGDFPSTGLIEFWVANALDAGYCGKFLFLFDRQTCPTHRHRMKHETFFVVKGSVRMRTDRRSRVLGEGAVLAVPPGVFHSFTAVGPALLLEVSQPSIRHDNFFKDKRVAGTGVI